ncbi:Retrotransposon protein, Ty3-gypsy subclass [Phytophthora cinnamomi]|uniref:Retrotransposon protein, Ty3-gypsy subclass n=1 Tax=Phytophthora cinnamomi TaxID=4785 RepID=UPI003559A0FC|nr:Retrotransposon protein, Ty3-gypsy subclass [Phytophthora cinnamomi]
MQDRRNFIYKYEGYLVKVNALQTEWTAALAMPVSACIETDTRRMIARWEFSGASPETITEEQWKDYFCQALVPTFVDYASIDTAMKSLKMQTKWPEPESRMMHLQADMEAIPNRFNVTDLAFKHEQRRLVGYLTKALEPVSFREVVATKLTLQEFKPLKNDAIGFCKNLACLVEDGNTSLDFTLGRPIMTVLGYSADELLVRARGTKSEWELGDKQQVGDDTETTARQRMCRMQTRARDIALDTMALEGLVDNMAPTDQDWGGSDTVHGGIDSPETIFKTKNLTPAYWQLPLSSSGAQVLAFKTLGGYSRLSRVPAGAHAAATENADSVERHETRTALPSLRLHDSSAVHDMLDSKLAAARAKGLSVKGVKRLRKILLRRQDSFRLEFGRDPPVKVALLQMRVKVNAQPTKAQPRRYSPDDRAFLDRHTAKLLEFGLVFLNHRSRWASAPRIVRKKEQDSDPTADPRMTIDTRGVNERTEAMSWPMPVLEVVLGALERAKVFFALDWFRGYWKLPLDEDSQELFTFITHRGMYTPTRVPMGATDAVAYCQGVVEEIFGDLLGNGILAWLDDILGYAEYEDELLRLLDQVLARCEAYVLKLHAKKCDFFEAAC